MRRETSEVRHAALLTARNPEWEVLWDARARVYRAWRIEDGLPVPPCLSNEEPLELEALIRRPVRDALTERLRDRIYELRDRGLLPRWSPGPEVPPQVRVLNL